MIQITYAYRAGLPVLNKDSNTKTTSILPVILGNDPQLEIKDAIAPLEKRFDVKGQVSFKNSVKVSSYVTYDKYDGVPDYANTFLYEPSIKEGANASGANPGGNEFDLRAQLSA